MVIHLFTPSRPQIAFTLLAREHPEGKRQPLAISQLVDQGNDPHWGLGLLVI